MSAARIAVGFVLVGSIAACPSSDGDVGVGFKAPHYVAKTGYCPDLIESCPTGSHPVTGARAVYECSDPALVKDFGWRVPERTSSLVLGKCLTQGEDCLVYCRLEASCQVPQISEQLACEHPTCGANGCETDLGERRACGPLSVANCVACPGDCPDGCNDGVDEPGESCEPCTPGTTKCNGDSVVACRSTGVGYEQVQDCTLANRGCSAGSCVSECGDGVCELFEDASTCPSDCRCVGTVHGCAKNELYQCMSGTLRPVQDCTATGQICDFGMCYTKNICGNMVCEGPIGETTTTCPADCM